MWKRLNNTNKGARPTMTIGTPILQETSLNSSDYSGLELPSQVSQDESYESYLPPARPSRMETKGLPSLPFEAQPPSPEQESSWRPASSAYYRAPLAPLNTRMPRDSYATVTTTYTEDDISPPSSPDQGAVKKHRNDNAYDDGVSPIDQTDSSQFEIRRPGSRPGHTSRPGSSSMPASNIPVLRRENKQMQVKAAAANFVARKEVGGKARPTQDPRWDPYSGEITTSDKGKPQSVKPKEFTPPTLQSMNGRGGPLGNTSNISAAPKAYTSFTDRVRNLKIGNNSSVAKPGWKGASGRVTLVNPVEDQPDVRPMHIPRKSSRRVASPEAMSPVSPFRRDETDGRDSPLTSHPMNQEQEYITRAVLANSATSSPRSASPRSPSPVESSPISVIHDPSEVQYSVADETQYQDYSTVGQLDYSNAHDQGNIPRSDTDGTIIRNFREALAESFPENKDRYEQPSSKFSFTTYAPSEPRQSTDTWERPEMPVLPPKAPSPILNRKRPNVLGDEPKMARKAISTSPVFISMATSVPRHRDSQLSILSKNLPQSPAEQQSNDLISTLQANIDNLQHRRKQIVKSIKQMTELMPQDRITHTAEVRAKREGEKLKVEALRAEEADIRKEEHELGLKLHRAYKRKDKDAVYEPTTLWVRRVTG